MTERISFEVKIHKKKHIHTKGDSVFTYLEQVLLYNPETLATLQTMTKKLVGDGEFSTESRASPVEPKIETGSLPSANQIWRDRLNKNKLNSQQKGLAGAPFNAVSANTHNRFGNTAPSNSARKTKKGLRPG